MEEFERLHGELGLRGVLIFSNIEGKPLDDNSMWPLYERAAAIGVPIWIHPSTRTSTRGSEATSSTAPWRGPSTRRWQWRGSSTAASSRSTRTSGS